MAIYYGFNNGADNGLNPLWLAMETKYFHIAQTGLFFDNYISPLGCPNEEFVIIGDLTQALQWREVFYSCKLKYSISEKFWG